MVVDFHHTNYYGENMVIVGTGEISHDNLVNFAEKYFTK
jgi:predicted Zn-dependent peptidase